MKLNKGIYIEDDNTKKEREIRRKLKWIAEMERGKREEGKSATVRYMKIKVEDKWYKWNKRKNELEAIEVRNRA